MSEPLKFGVMVSPAERAAVVCAAEQLSSCLGQACGERDWPIHLTLLEPDATPAPGQTAIIASLMAEAADAAEPIAATTARWRSKLRAMQATGAPVLILNVFRHVAGRAGDGSVSPLAERIGRLNLMAVRLSGELNVGVVDIDRAFAHIGARALQTDYRLGGLLAAEVAGHTLAWALLSFGLDNIIDPDLQERAQAALGPLAEINAIVTRRLARRARASSAATT